MTDTDSPWKEILEHYFEPFMSLFFLEAHGEIDWERGYEFLYKELQQITREAEIGKRTVDKLVKVWLKDGKEAWVLVHMEVQSREDLEFEERMFVYHYRIFDRYRRQVVSLAVLADEKESWRPAEFSYGRWGCEMQFRFPVIKLLDFRKDTGRLQAAKGNPFAVVVDAHLLAMATRRDADSRLQSKFQLIKRLYMEGYRKQEIVDLFRFIDWIMDLPEGHERLFWKELAKYEEGKKMTYVTSVERIGMEKGIRQGIRQGMLKEAREMVQEAISSRFGTVPEDIAGEIRRFENKDILRMLLRQAIVCSDLTVFRKMLKEARC